MEAKTKQWTCIMGYNKPRCTHCDECLMEEFRKNRDKYEQDMRKEASNGTGTNR